VPCRVAARHPRRPGPCLPEHTRLPEAAHPEAAHAMRHLEARAHHMPRRRSRRTWPCPPCTRCLCRRTALLPSARLPWRWDSMRKGPASYKRPRHSSRVLELSPEQRHRRQCRSTPRSPLHWFPETANHPKPIPPGYQTSCISTELAGLEAAADGAALHCRPSSPEPPRLLLRPQTGR
jgi:hypothetical protein